ncbi:MAG: hypothetical protein ACYTFY_01320 [Planctomycetota bacterium]|jgi:hypothetical protein
MEFIKNWLVWIILGVIVLVCMIFRLVVISSYVAEEEESTKKLLSFQKTAEKKVSEIRRKKVPTRGDIKQAQEMLKDIENEWAQTAEKWKKASVWLDERHGKDPEQEYSVFLLNKCTEACDKLALSRVRHIRGREWKPEPDFKAANLCDRESHQLADLTKDFHSVEETMETWRRYLIAYKIHEVCARTKVDVTNANSLDSEKGTLEKPAFKVIPQVRTVEYLGKVEFGDVITAEAANGEEETTDSDGRRGHKQHNDDEEKPEENKSKVYHDTYPVSFEVVAHIKVIQQIMKNVLRSKKLNLVFVPSKAEIIRFTDEETRPSEETAAEEDTAVNIGKDLNYINEPPVTARLSYNIYHFRSLQEDKGKKEK